MATGKSAEKAKVLAREEHVLQKFDGDVIVEEDGTTTVPDGVHLLEQITVTYDHEKQHGSVKKETFDADGNVTDVSEESGTLELQGE